MILFENQYSHLSSDHFDVNTANVSFIRMHQILRKMNIKNNKFFLVILDKELKGIDPHNLPDNSMELKLRIARECKINPWYFFREMIRIPSTGSKPVRFRLNRASLSLIWLFFNHIDNLLIMPRQLGKTIGSISISAAIIYVLGRNTTFSMLTKDSKLRKENVSRLKDIRDALPEWFINKSRQDTDNSEELSYTILDNNKYNTFVAQGSVSGAERLGRGMTVPSQHWDEIAYFLNISITYPIAISSTTTAIENAKAAGQSYGNILTTTAGKLNTEEGRFTHNLICNSLVFSEKLYDLPNEAELLKVVQANSRQAMVYSEFNYKQLGKTDEWFKQTAARTVGGEDIINRDLLNRWTYGTDTNPIDKKFLERMYESKREPEYIQYVDEFLIRWYIPDTIVKVPSEFSKIPIIIGMDASENVGRDFTSLVLIDARNMSVIGTCLCNTVNIIKVSQFICRWLIKYDNILFVPERNSVGCAIIDYCLLQLDSHGINPFFRIYNDVIQNLETYKLNKASLMRPGIYNEYRKLFGFRTSSSSRTFLYKTVFFKVLELASHVVQDQGIINEIAGLSIKNGRIDHSGEGHDDSVIAYILTAYVLFFGNHLDMYDFSNNDTDWLLKGLETVTDGITGNTIDAGAIESISAEIRRIEGRIRYETDPTSKIELIHKLNDYKSKLPKDDDGIIAKVNSITELKPKKQVLAGDTSANSSFISSYLTEV